MKEKKEKLDTVEATKISMSFGRGRRQVGKLKRVQEQEEAFRNVPGNEEDQLTTQPLNYSLINTGASQEAGVKWFFFVRLESLHGPQECHDVKREQNRNQIK